MEKIKIYSSSGELIWSDFVDDDSYRLREIMGDNRLELNFSLDYFFEMLEGDYCEFKAERYWMPRAQKYVKEHSEKFIYHLEMEGSTWFTKATKFKFFDYVKALSPQGEGWGEVTPTSSFKLKFPLTGSPVDFAKMFVANLKLKYPEYPWAVGDCIESVPITIDFNKEYCFDLLAKLADRFSTEWELDKYTLHIRKVEKMKASAVDLSYGFNNGLLGGIERLQYDNKKIINRVYIEAGDRNIDESIYRNPTLLLPKDRRITHEGVEYKTDASGSYLERVTPLAGEEDGLDITKFYPKRVGVISSVIKVDDSKGLYDIIDSSIPASLDFSKLIIAGETMTIIFQTGQLAGKEFDVKYNHSTRKFELVPINENGLVYPKGNLIPAVGDKYAVFHMQMPSEYITEAEEEALLYTVKYLADNERAQYTYRFTLDGLYAKRNWGEIRGFLNPGFFVKFSDPQFLPDPVDVRIVAVKEYINDDKAPEITIANNVSSKTFGSVLNEVPTQEQATDRKDQEVINYAKRGFRQAQETMQMLIDAALDGFDEAIKPIAIQSMMGLFGSEALAYYYVTSKTNPVRLPSGISFSKSTKRITCPVGIIQHQTIGLGGKTLTSLTPNKYTYWNTKAYQSDELTEDTAYYLYLLCAKMNLTNGRYILSKTNLSADDYPDDYVLLVGVLNKEDESGDRSWIELFGMTEILPGRINTDRVNSLDGLVYFDLLNGILKAGGLEWNIVPGLLKLLNAMLEFRNDDDELIAKIDGTTGDAMFGKGAHHFYADERLNLAKGNILWDLINGLIVTGKYQSATSGKRFVIEPEGVYLRMYHENGNIEVAIETAGSSGTSIRLYDHTTGKIKAWLSKHGITFYDDEGNDICSIGSESNVINSATFFENAKIILNGIATSDYGLVSNQLYRSGNHVMIK